MQGSRSQGPRLWPRDRARDGYRFISRRCDRYGSDVFTTRLLFEPTICMRGAAAAEVFYDTDRFTRARAAPDRLVKTLFGEGGVQALDGEAHRVRKQLFLSLMTPDGIGRFIQLATSSGARLSATAQSLRDEPCSAPRLMSLSIVVDPGAQSWTSVSG